MSVISTGTDSTAYLPRFVAIARLSGAGFTSHAIEPFRPVTIPEPATRQTLPSSGCREPAVLPIRTGGSSGIAQIALVYEQVFRHRP